MAWRVAQQGAERVERQAAAEEAEERAAAEDAREARLMRFQQLGIAPRSLADVFADASRAGDEDAELEAARATVRRIEKRQAQRTLAAERQAEQLAEVERAASADPLQQAAQRAHAAFRVHTRAQLARAEAAPRRERRPFGGRGSVAARSEQCVHCINQGASDEESYLLHSDPEYAVPLTPPEQVAQTAERRTAGRGYAMAVR